MMRLVVLIRHVVIVHPMGRGLLPGCCVVVVSLVALPV